MAHGEVGRLALILSPAPGVTKLAFEAGLGDRRDRLRGLARAVGGSLRIGTRDPEDPLANGIGGVKPEPVEGAVEITTGYLSMDALCGSAVELGLALASLIDPRRSALAVGVTHQIVAPREGLAFLSLAFRREPGTTVEEFRDWWLNQHAKVATPLLLPELLAYDQVHVDHQLSEKASAEAGIAYHPYDAYDNLTWASVAAFVASTSKPGAAEEMYRDEVGHLDHATYRGSLLRVLG